MIVLAKAYAGAKIGCATGVLPHDHLHTAADQTGEIEPAAVSSIRDQYVACLQRSVEFAKQANLGRRLALILAQRGF